jgi:peptide/nickel transport system substrate-binding protein
MSVTARASTKESSRAWWRVRRRRVVVAMLPLVTTVVVVTGCGGGHKAAGSTTAGDGQTQNGVIADWGGTINTSGTPVKGGTLRIDQQTAPNGITPLSFIGSPQNQAMQVAMQVFDTLVEYQPGAINPKPGLAQSWTVSPDGLTYTFHLRQAKFSNGMPVTATDVKYSLDRERGPKSFFADTLFKTVKNVDAPDATTVVVHLSQPTPALLFYLGSIAAGVVPAKVVKSEGDARFNRQPIGSGPFVVASWTKGREVVLKRNPNYWVPGRPYLDQVTLTVTPSDNTRVLNVESGTSDVADYAPFSQISTIDRNGSAHVLVAPGLDMFVVFLNNDKKPLDETAVRQALYYATPVASISKVVFAGLGPIMNTIIPKTKYWTNASKAYPYDLQKAKQVLGGSSVPKGFSTTLTFSSSDQASGQVAQILKSSWAKIGVKLNLNPSDDALVGQNYSSGKSEMTVFAPGGFTSDVPVDDEFASLMFDSPATHDLYTWYRNPVTQKLASEAVTEMNETKRRNLFQQLHIESMKNPPVIPMVYTPNRAAVRNDVHNFNYLLAGFWRLDQVWKG